MKKIIGYLIVIVIGVLGIILMIERADEMDRLAKTNEVELYS